MLQASPCRTFLHRTDGGGGFGLESALNRFRSGSLISARMASQNPGDYCGEKPRRGAVWYDPVSSNARVYPALTKQKPRASLGAPF